MGSSILHSRREGEEMDRSKLCRLRRHLELQSLWNPSQEKIGRGSVRLLRSELIQRQSCGELNQFSPNLLRFFEFLIEFLYFSVQ